MERSHTIFRSMSIEDFGNRIDAPIPLMASSAPAVRLGLEYRSILNDIRRMDADLDRTILGEADYAALVIDACSGNIHWSLLQEGHPFSEEEMRRMCDLFTRGQRVGEKGNIAQQEVYNHMQAHLQRDRYPLPWSNEDLQALHILLNTGCGFPAPPGNWRRKEMTDGIKHSLPEMIEEDVRALLTWLSFSPYDELLTALLFLRDLLRISPFEYSNELTARAIFLILISNLGLENSRLCHMEKDFLKPFLPPSNETVWEDEATVSENILELARSLRRSYCLARTEFGERNILKDLDENSRTLALKAKENINWLSVSEACSWLPSLSEQRVRQKLNELVALGVMEKEGRTRATRFRFKDPFLALRETLRLDNGQ
ncbi:MAG: hypothetical protein WCY65_02705 [Candidatus Methanomethylophilaceae archaeon]